MANFCYYQIYRFESFITSVGNLSDADAYSSIIQTPTGPDRDLQNLYRKTFHLTVQLWSFLGASTHFTIVAILALLHKVHLIYPIFIAYSIGLYILLIFYQSVLVRRFVRDGRALLKKEHTN